MYIVFLSIIVIHMHVTQLVVSSAFCESRADGIFAVQDQCWAFVTCGDDFGGEHMRSCFPRRRFDESMVACIPDDACVGKCCNLLN